MSKRKVYTPRRGFHSGRFSTPGDNHLSGGGVDARMQYVALINRKLVYKLSLFLLTKLSGSFAPHWDPNRVSEVVNKPEVINIINLVHAMDPCPLTIDRGLSATVVVDLIGS